MDQLHSNTDDTSRKRGTHLTLDQRGAIQILKRQGLSLRAIADAVGCAHATVWYELRRSRPQRTSSRGRIPLYMAKRGQVDYNEHRTYGHKPCKLDNDLFEPFNGSSSRSVKSIVTKYFLFLRSLLLFFSNI